MKNRHEMFHLSGQFSKPLPKKEHANARYPTIHHIEPICQQLPALGSREGKPISPFGLPPALHIPEIGFSIEKLVQVLLFGVALRRRGSPRRVVLFCNHAAEEARGVDRGRLDGSTPRDGARVIRRAEIIGLELLCEVVVEGSITKEPLVG